MSEQISKLLSDADLYLSVSKLAVARAAELSWESRAKLLIRPFAELNFAEGTGTKDVN